MLYTISAIFLCETGPIQWMFNQHCGCWWPGALAVLTMQPCVSWCLGVNENCMSSYIFFKSMPTLIDNTNQYMTNWIHMKQAVPINGDNIPPLWSLPTLWISINIQQRFLFCSHCGYYTDGKPTKLCFQEISGTVLPTGCSCHGVKKFWKPTFQANIRHHRAAIDSRNMRKNRGQESHPKKLNVNWANIF